MTAGVHDEIFKHNSRVYAARTDGGMGGLFALVDAARGNILVEYTGKLITLKAATMPCDSVGSGR